MKRNIENASHYVWGEACDGWILCSSQDMMVIQERMPPGTAEQRHFHLRSRQFFYVLDGELTMELEGEHYVIGARSGIEIPPGARHQARNDSSSQDVHFLVTSSPSTRGDRTDLT